MGGGQQSRGGHVPPRGWRPWISAGLLAAVCGAGLCGLALAGLGLLLAMAATAPFAALGYGLLLVLGRRRLAVSVVVTLPLLLTGLAVIHKGALSITVLVILAGLAVGPPAFPAALLGVRQLAVLTRRLSGQWCGVPIAGPYRPPAADDWSAEDWPAGGRPGWERRLRWLLGDPAGRRDLLWFAVNALVGWVLTAAPAGLIGYGIFGLVMPGTGHQDSPVPPPAFPGSIPEVLLAAGVGAVALGLWAGPWLLRGYGIMARSMLGPGGEVELALRVTHLARTRAETIDASAAELRRIERDLHDGAQARLVALGMTLDAASRMVARDPAARAILAEARESSAKVLTELRDLVRGIHPPVLADRGLAEAVRALALELPLPVHFVSELEGRPPAPVESAAYFAVSELLANVSKHAHARQAWVDLRHTHGMLQIAVTDDGAGGADPGRGTGLAGVERRLGAFDGVLALSSPPGGPTAVNLEIPCALSSPKTSSC